MLNVLSLTEFVLGIFLVDYVETALAAYDFAVGGALLDRCFYFHCLSINFGDIDCFLSYLYRKAMRPLVRS